MLYGIEPHNFPFGGSELLSDVNTMTDGEKVAFILNLRGSGTISSLIEDARKYDGVKYLGCSEFFSKVLLDKFLTKDFFQSMGFSVTKGCKVMGDAQNIQDNMKKLGFIFPVLLKETHNTGGQGIYIVVSLEELLLLELNGQNEYVLEEFVYGDEYSCNLFVRGEAVTIFPTIHKGATGICDGRPIHSLEKIRTSCVDPGIDRKIRDIGYKIGQIEGINGFLEIEFIMDSNTGAIKIIEINPRLSGTTDLAVLSAAHSYEEIVILLSENRPDESTNILQSKILVEYPIKFVTPDFVPLEIKVKGGSVLKTKYLRKFPPFLQKVLIEFDDTQSYITFLEQYGNSF